MHYYGLFKPGYTHRDPSNTTESVPPMKLWLVLLAMGLLTTCLHSGKMEGVGGVWDRKGKIVMGWNKKCLWGTIHITYCIYRTGGC